MKFKYIVPLITFLIPTIIITAFLFYHDPPAPILMGGFVLLLIGVCGSYFMGIQKVLKDK